MVLALALPALGQTEPQLEPLVPRSATPPRKKQRKPQPQPALPPLAPLAPPRRGTATVGVLVLGAVPDAVAVKVNEGLRSVLKLAPPVKDAIVLEAPQPCTNQACWIVAGAAANVDQVLVAALAGGTLRIKLVDVARRKQVAQAHQERVSSSDPAEATAWAEAVACKLLVPEGCTGEVLVEAPEGVELLLDGQPLQRGEKRMVPVGVHTLRIKEGDAVSSRPIPVLHEGAIPVSIASTRPAPPAVPVASAPVEAAPVAAVGATPTPPPRRTWTRKAGYATAGVALVAAAAGVWFGAKSRSDLDRAESAYRANGGVYQSADLDALRSGNSSARTANVLFIASGVLLATGAALTFAF
jgi:hypothetical protein